MMKRLYNFIIILFLVFFIFFSIVGIQFYHFITAPLPVSENGYVLVIPPGTPVQKIAEILHQDGVVEYPSWLMFRIRWRGAWTQLKAGEYLIKSGTTVDEFIEQVREGRVIQYALTLVEGWNFEQVMNAIKAAPKLKQTLTDLSKEDIMMKIGHPGEHPEGRFFPDTYYFPAGTTDVAFLQRAYTQLHERLSKAWEKRSETLSLKSSYEVLILASIIEKESNLIDEYPEIAGVYMRRLKINMPLQADPTVVYGMGPGFTGSITSEMLKNPTPYNTYQKTGLPPTPIAMPSQKALDAAVNPKAGDSLYFVAKVEGKGHIFSKTYEEHQAAVLQYRKASAKEGS